MIVSEIAPVVVKVVVTPGAPGPGGCCVVVGVGGASPTGCRLLIRSRISNCAGSKSVRALAKNSLGVTVLD